jgi:hypothetical protein
VKSDADEALEYQIETLLYLRDLDPAYRKIADLANKYWEEESYDFAAAILKLTSGTLFTQAIQVTHNAPDSCWSTIDSNACLDGFARLGGSARLG